MMDAGVVRDKVWEQFDDCLHSHFPQPGTKRKGLGQVIAGVVMERRGASPLVVALGTGTKCALLKNVKKSEGRVIVDHHAEVIARRAFLRFLWKELLKCCLSQVQCPAPRSRCRQQESSIFEPATGTCMGAAGVLRHRRRFKLCDEAVAFHLYVSQPPCPGYQPLKQGGFVKVEDRGTIALAKCGGDHSSIQAKSCIDKVRRWTALGIQGTLLSRFIDPIYLRSIVVGGSDPEASSRVSEYLCDPVVVESFDHRGYRPHCPTVAYVTPSTFACPSPQKSSNEGMNWCLNDEVEIIEMQKGKLFCESKPSRLCKQGLLECYWDVLKACRLYGNGSIEISYAKLKQRVAPDHCAAKSYYELVVSSNLVFCKGLGTFVAALI